MVAASQVVLTATERVHLGVPAAQAIAAEAERLNAQRVFILAGSTLNEQTDEIRKIEKALGSRHAATHTGIRPNAPRSDVLVAAERARAVNTDLVVTVGGGSVTDAGKIILICLKHNITTIEHIEKRDPSKTMSENPFDVGKRRNWEQVFGSNPWLWFFPVAIVQGDGVNWDTASGISNDSFGGKTLSIDQKI